MRFFLPNTPVFCPLSQCKHTRFQPADRDNHSTSNLFNSDKPPHLSTNTETITSFGNSQLPHHTALSGINQSTAGCDSCPLDGEEYVCWWACALYSSKNRSSPGSVAWILIFPFFFFFEMCLLVLLDLLFSLLFRNWRFIYFLRDCVLFFYPFSCKNQ